MSMPSAVSSTGEGGRQGFLKWCSVIRAGKGLGTTARGEGATNIGRQRALFRLTHFKPKFRLGMDHIEQNALNH
jgi:hypothetical protein